VWLLLLTGSSTGLSARDNITAVLKCESTIDVCGTQDDKRVLLTLNIGNVTAQDSLLGFNFELTYDTTKLVFNTAIYQNTLSENAKPRDINFEHPGIISGWAYSNSLLYGDKPLVGILGTFKENCKDTTTVNISILEFIETYKNTVTDYQPALISGLVTAKSDRILIPKFDTDSFHIDTNMTGTMNFGINATSGLRLNNLKIKIGLTDTSQVQITGLLSLTDNISIDSLNYISDGITALITYKNPMEYGNQLSVQFRQVNYKSEPCGMTVEIQGYNDCSCVTGNQSAESFIVTKHIDTTDIKNNEAMNGYILNSYYDPSGDAFRINMNISDLYTVNVYSIQGSLLIHKKYDTDTEIIDVDAYGIPKGVYILRIERRMNDMKNIMLIKY
jgi:hypothetical protein